MRGWTPRRAEPILSLLRTFLPLRRCSYSTLGTVGVRGYTVCSYKKVVARAAFLQCLVRSPLQRGPSPTSSILSRGEAVVVAVYSTVLPSLLPCAQLCVANAAPRGSVTLTCVHAIIPRSSAQGASTLSFTPPPTTGYRSTASYQSARASVRNHSPSFFLLYQK